MPNLAKMIIITLLHIFAIIAASTGHLSTDYGEIARSISDESGQIPPSFKRLLKGTDKDKERYEQIMHKINEYKESFVSNLGYLKVLLAMHMQLISDVDAMNLLGITLVSDQQDKLILSPKIIANMFGDSLMAMEKNISKLPKTKEEIVLSTVNDETPRLEVEGFSQEPWQPMYLNSLEGTGAVHFAIFIIKSINLECLAKESKAGCSAEERRIWRNLGTYALSSAIRFNVKRENVHEIIELLYKETRGEALFVASIQSKSEGHELLVHVKSDDGQYFDVRLYNTGFGRPNVMKKSGDKDRAADDAFFKTFERRYMDLEGLRSYDHFIVSDKSEDDFAKITKRIYPEDRVYDEAVDRNPYHYSRQQRAGTCVATVLWAWLRSLGPKGVKMEMMLKGIVLEDLVHRYSKIQEVIDANPPPEMPESTEMRARDFYRFKYNRWWKGIKESTKEFVGEVTFLRDQPAVFIALSSNTINEVAEFLIWIASQGEYKAATCALYDVFKETLLRPFFDIAEVYDNVRDIVIPLSERSCPYKMTSDKVPEAPYKYDLLLQEIKDKCAPGEESSPDCYEVIYYKTIKDGPLNDKLIQKELERILNAWKIEDSPSPAISTLLCYKLYHYSNGMYDFKPKKTQIFHEMFAYLNERVINEFDPTIEIYTKEEGRGFLEGLLEECGDPEFDFSFKNARDWAKCVRLFTVL